MYKTFLLLFILNQETWGSNFPLLAGGVHHPSNHLCGPLLALLQQVHVLPMLSTQRWMQHWGWALTRAEWKGRILSPTLLALLVWDAAQVTSGFLAPFDQQPQIFLGGAALSLFFLQPAFILVLYWLFVPTAHICYQEDLNFHVRLPF